MHAQDLPEDAPAPDLPFFRTSEIPRSQIPQWDRNNTEGVPTGLPSLIDLDERDLPPLTPASPPGAIPTDEIDAPIHWLQVLCAGLLSGGILGSTLTYWLAVGF